MSHLTLRTQASRLGALCLTGLLAASAAPADDLKLNIVRHYPNNLFDSKESVAFSVKAKGSPAGGAEIVARLTDENAKEVAVKSLSEFQEQVEIDFGIQPRGYYELRLLVDADGDGPEEPSVADMASLGVVDFVNRSAKEVRDGNYVFGLKWWAGIHDQPEMMESMSKLGLQWTRVIQHEGMNNEKRLNITEIFTEYPMNAAIKVERFPVEAYDEERYGPLDEYSKLHGRGHWVIKTIPKRDVYSKWLKEQLTRIPEEQNVFEIWNEAWDKMSPEDFAELCQLVAEIILEVRPDAIIGPNLKGLTGKYEFDARVIEAGGMERMKMVALHPYSNPTDRKAYREFKSWIEKKVGRELKVYITEYGSHSTPEGPQRQSEIQQARNIAQRSVVLYSNGVQGLVPHIAVSSESNKTYWDDWLGLFRRNEEPKPAIIAHATAARMIDGSEYLGDLWFGTAVEAMVFDRKGTGVLALWHIDPTLDRSEENASRKEIEIPVDGELVVTNILGRETVLKPENGVVNLTLDESPVYVTGFKDTLLADVSRELRPDRWPVDQVPPRPVRKAGKFTTPPVLDGKLDEWDHAFEVAFVNEAVNAKDASGISYISWDGDHLWIGAYMRDNEILNQRVLGKLYQQDSIELFVSTEPRDTGSGFGPNDHQFFLTPTSTLGKGLVAEMTQRESGEVVLVDDAVYFAGPSGWGWAVEVGIPWSTFNDFKPEPGTKLMLDMRLNDADRSHERWKLDPGDNDRFSVFDPVTWGFVELVE